jgi:hypothetical protein
VVASDAAAAIAFLPLHLLLLLHPPLLLLLRLIQLNLFGTRVVRCILLRLRLRGGCIVA